MSDLVELKTRITHDEDDNVASHVEIELRIHPHEIEDALGTILVCFTQATLALEINGVEVAPNSKFGQPVASPTKREVTRETTTAAAKDTSTEGKATVGGKLSVMDQSASLEASAGASQKRSASQSVKETETVSTTHIPVRAVGSDKWTITSENGVLDAVYLDYDRLCSLSPVWGGNRQTVTTYLLVKQKHMRAALEPRDGVVNAIFQTVNQMRIANILAAKSIHSEASSSPYSGVICLAKSEATDEE
ncbi:hypothetical protein [Devosia neptuniae]|uniref:hypothetical protein n=1 Tax=Devosia neptuniae TaxID=191302 RepID=UPI0022AEB9B9|nr:hypothetical protein [Devosia neptuniae]MCZ4345499.1 hypothetical protein [Devosia neptuniae]